jgi:hypothetical protein
MKKPKRRTWFANRRDAGAYYLEMFSWMLAADFADCGLREDVADVIRDNLICGELVLNFDVERGCVRLDARDAEDLFPAASDRTSEQPISQGEGLKAE